jgi:lipopolysaccharide/colanic/teichoic acid biosynthesis glycosyltransferase
MDLRYVRTRSLGSDLVILAKTFPAVLMRRGAK